MTVTESDLNQLVPAVWETVLGVPAVPVPGAEPPRDLDDFLTACVQVTGAWTGAVTLDCPTPLARQLAGILFDRDPAACPQQEVRDALGELVNIVGGNLKPLLPPACHLSLPAVASGNADRSRVVGAAVVARAGFDCRGQPLVVTVLERHPDQGAE